MPPSYSPCPRPCLKRSSLPSSIPSSPQDEPSTLLAIDPSILSPIVRFPPHAALAHTLGNAIPYDRSPIVVLPNRCALPERGCPGRTYAPDDLPTSHARRNTKRTSLSPPAGRHLHPRAVPDHDLRSDDDPTPRQSPRVDYHPLPPLIPDLSSESSEESDGIASPPPELYSGPSYAKMSLEQSLMNLTLAGTNAPSTSALSFLPHPPSPRVRPSTSPSHSPSNSQSYPPGMSNTSPNYYRTSSPVRSRSPSSPTHRRKSRPTPIPVPSPTSGAAYLSSSPPHTATSSHPGVPASPERERRSRHRDDTRGRERRDRERAERLARYQSLSEASSTLNRFGYDDSSCLGGF